MLLWWYILGLIFSVDYRDDRKDPQNYVTVSLEIKGIKKKVFGEGAANANITFTKDNR